MLTVFLDIDGVLRRNSAPKYKLEAPLVTKLGHWIRVQEKEVELVISSTWKDAFPLDEIRSMFPLALRVKIVGRTPTLTGGDYPRFDEVKAYNIKHGVEEWIAFDDQPDLFPPGLPNVVAIDGEIGFQ